ERAAAAGAAPPRDHARALVAHNLDVETARTAPLGDEQSRLTLPRSTRDERRIDGVGRDESRREVDEVAQALIPDGLPVTQASAGSRSDGSNTLSSPGAIHPNALTPFLTQSLPVTSAILCHDDRCCSATAPAALRSCPSAPRSSPAKSSASSK